MLKSIEKLLDCRDGLKVGNHSSKRIHSVFYYMYHGTVICEADFDTKEFRLPYNGAYSHSVSKTTISAIFSVKGSLLPKKPCKTG